LCCFFLSAVAASAGTVSGVVHNGTNNKPAGGIDVLLIQLQGTMQNRREHEKPTQMAAITSTIRPSVAAQC